VDSKFFIIIPAFNEGAVIGETLRDILSLDYTVIVVDDASTDETASIVRGFPVYYLRHKVNLGQGAALQTGISFALSKGAEVFVTFDADGQHVAADIPAMTSSLATKDIIFGSRFMDEAPSRVPFLRKCILHFARYLNFALTGILLTDAHNGLRVFNSHAALALQLVENRMSHATEILILAKKHKLRYKEMPVHIRYTAYSKKKGQSVTHSFKVLQDIFLYKIFK